MRLLLLALLCTTPALAAPRLHPKGLTFVEPLATLPHLTWFGGPVVSQPKVALVLWGSQVDAQSQAGLPGFYTAILASPYFDWLSEYDTSAQHFLRGSFLGTYTIAPAVLTGHLGLPALEQELDAQVTAGNLPAPDGNTLLAVHLPPGLVVSAGFFDSCAQGGFCSLHNAALRPAGGEPILYTVLPDMGPGSGCDTGCFGGTTFEILTSNSSHELVEAVTDPQIGLSPIDPAPPLAWYDEQPPDPASVHGEIADICSTGALNPDGGISEDQARVGAYAVQREWSNAASGCIATRDDQITASLTPAVKRVNGAGPLSFQLQTTAPTDGSTPLLALSLIGLPTGVSGSIAPAAVTAGSSATLSLDVERGAPAAFTLLALAAGPQATGWAAADVELDDFSISPPGETAITAGSTLAVSVGTALTAGSAPQPVTLSLPDAPAWLGATFSPEQVTAGAASSLSLTVAHGTASGTYSVSMLGTGGLLTHPALLVLSVAGDDFELTVSPRTAMIERGGAAVFTVSTSVVKGVAQTLLLSTPQLPLGLSSALDPPTVAAGETSKLTIYANPGIAFGPHTAVVQADGVTASLRSSVLIDLRPSGCTSGGDAGLLCALALLARRRRKR